MCCTKKKNPLKVVQASMDVIISQVGGNVFSGVGGRELPKTAGIIVNVSAIVFISY